MGKCRTKLDGSRPSFLSQNSLRILIPETRVSQNVLFRYKPQHAICNWIWCKRAMLGFERHGVSITGELLHDIFGHGEVNISLGVIPLEVDATIEITGAVFDDVVRLSLEGFVEVL